MADPVKKDSEDWRRTLPPLTPLNPRKLWPVWFHPFGSAVFIGFSPGNEPLEMIQPSAVVHFILRALTRTRSKL
jgi:hypothetical protein